MKYNELSESKATAERSASLEIHKCNSELDNMADTVHQCQQKIEKLCNDNEQLTLVYYYTLFHNKSQLSS